MKRSSNLRSPHLMREYQIIRTDFIDSCRVKRRRKWHERWSIGSIFIVGFTLSLFVMLLVFLVNIW